MKLQEKIGSNLITIECSDKQEEQSRSVLKKLTELNQIPPGLNNGTIIRFGWSDLKLIQKNNELVLHEPDFTKDPFHDFLPHISNTLDVLIHQLHTLGRVKAEATDCLYSQKILIQKGCLGKQAIYLERSHDKDPAYSGWYIGETENEKEITADDLESIYVYELLLIRPAVIKVLALPIGYLAVIIGNSLEAVIDPKGINALV